MTTKPGKLYTEAVRVKKIEHGDVLAELQEAVNVFSGWSDRFAATPGDNARFIQKQLDVVSLRALDALIAVRTTLGR